MTDEPESPDTDDEPAPSEPAAPAGVDLDALADRVKELVLAALPKREDKPAARQSAPASNARTEQDFEGAVRAAMAKIGGSETPKSKEDKPEPDRAPRRPGSRLSRVLWGFGDDDE